MIFWITLHVFVCLCERARSIGKLKCCFSMYLGKNLKSSTYTITFLLLDVSYPDHMLRVRLIGDLHVSIWLLFNFCMIYVFHHRASLRILMELMFLSKKQGYQQMLLFTRYDGCHSLLPCYACGKGHTISFFLISS